MNFKSNKKQFLIIGWIMACVIVIVLFGGYEGEAWLAVFAVWGGIAFGVWWLVYKISKKKNISIVIGVLVSLTMYGIFQYSRYALNS